MQRIALTNGMFALIDDEDYAVVSQYNWQIGRTWAGCYARTSVIESRVKRVLLMHRLIMDTPEGMLTDHVNGDGLDNRRANLRVCSWSQNMMNRRKLAAAKSRYKGVSWSADKNKWRAVIKINGRAIHVGRYSDEIDAARAYDAKAKELFGSFARLNFPE